MNRALLAGLVGLVTAATSAAAKDAAPASDVEAGRALYRQYCASCHGAQAEGAPNWREPNAAGELPAPPHGPEGHTWHHSDAVLFRMISEGWRDPFNRTDRLTMPAFEAVLTPQEIRSVIAYLKTLWAPEQRQFQAEETGTGRSMSDARANTPENSKGELQ